MKPAPCAVFERVVAASPARVWSLWTEAEHFGAWYGPKGATIVVSQMDVRVGGRRHVGMQMQTPKGPMKMWFAGEHQEVASMSKLVYTEGMANEDGELVSPAAMGMPADHPGTTVVHVQLRGEGDQTHMTVTHQGIAQDSPGAMGWKMALDKLQAYA